MQHSPANPASPGSRSTRRKLLFASATTFVFFAVVELIASWLYVRGDLEPESIWIHERRPGAASVKFDPIFGYRLAAESSRLAVVATNGEVETVGALRGNNLGLPDRDDFGPQRDRANARRIAVFGDSFSSAQFLKRNWLDRAEDLSRETNRPLQLLNFSVDGGGLVNWQSTLVRHVWKEHYELDGILFAVYANDLAREFMMWDEQFFSASGGGEHRMFFGRGNTRRLAALPQTIGEASAFVMPAERWFVCSPERLDRILTGEERVPAARSWRPYFTGRLLSLASSPASPTAIPHFESDEALAGALEPSLSDIRYALGQLQVPVFVMLIPSRIAERGPVQLDDSARAVVERFARLLEATFLDGSEPFARLSQSELDACWLKYDHHWSQVGSDRFAEFAVKALANWPQPTRKPHPSAEALPSSGDNND